MPGKETSMMVSQYFELIYYSSVESKLWNVHTKMVGKSDCCSVPANLSATEQTPFIPPSRHLAQFPNGDVYMIIHHIALLKEDL